MKKKLQEGDVFYIERSGKYFFGKLLLDIDERIFKIEESHDNLNSYRGCYLVAVYTGIYDTPVLQSTDFIIPSAFVFKKYFYSKKHKVDWTFYRHEPIDFKEIDFPESLLSYSPKGIFLRKGELVLETNITNEQYDTDFKVLGGVEGSFYSLVDIASHYQNRDELMKIKRVVFLDSSDFRFAPEKRKIIYEQIEENPNQSYYELALKHGFDLGRFYKQK